MIANLITTLFAVTTLLFSVLAAATMFAVVCTFDWAKHKLGSKCDK